MAARTKTKRVKSDRPIMVLLDLLSQRWALRILWELREAPLTFRDLREACDDLSPTVLNTRLRTFRDHGLVDLSDEGYVFTKLGEELGSRVFELNGWANKWARGTKP